MRFQWKKIVRTFFDEFEVRFAYQNELLRNSVFYHCLKMMIGSMLVFAVLYACLPGEFYHSSLQYETEMKKEDQEMSELLKKEIIENAFENGERNRQRFFQTYRMGILTLPQWTEGSNSSETHGILVVGNGYSFNLDMCELYDLKRERDDLISFKLALNDIKSSNDELNYSALIKVVLRVEDEVSYSGISDLYHKLYYRLRLLLLADERPDRIYQIVEITPVRVPDEIRGLDFARLFPSTSHFKHAGINRFLSISEQLDYRFKEFLLHTKGMSSGIGDNFSRMLYYSTVTITTIGCADIVPIASRSRFLSSLEAMWGVCIFGYFIKNQSRKPCIGYLHKSAHNRYKHVPDTLG